VLRATIEWLLMDDRPFFLQRILFIKVQDLAIQ